MIVSEDYVNLLKHVREMCQTGQTAGAELELHSVYRQAGCPDCVKVLLAAMLARRGRHEEAKAVLMPLAPDAVDQHAPGLTRLTISVLTTLGCVSEAEALSKAYHKAFGREATRWLREMSAPGSKRLPNYTRQQVDELAEDLSREPKAIATLVYAQKHKRDLPTVQLLHRAIRRIVPLFENDDKQMTMACLAMADLSVLAGDHTQAQRWAHRGLEVDPYNASLALLIDNLRDDGRTTLPPRTVLLCAATKHPGYPDVQSALIRRETAEGRLDDARDRLSAWLEREPYSPHALALRKEIAA